MNVNPVFVYGTLRKGASNHFRMAGAEFMGIGQVGGRIFRIDWYPALKLGGESLVKGEVYLVSDSLLAELDIFEGIATEEDKDAEYRRVEVTVNLVSGESTQAWVWEWVGELADARQLDSADWLAHEPNPSD